MWSSFSLSRRLTRVVACYYSTSLLFPAKWHYIKRMTSSSSSIHQLRDVWVTPLSVLLNIAATKIHMHIFPWMCFHFIPRDYFMQVQFSSVAQSSPTLCDPMNHNTPGLPVHHQLLEFTQTHVHWVGDAIQPSHPLSTPSPALNLSQHQGLFKCVSPSYQVAKLLEFQLQHQSFQWTPRTDLL